MTGLALFGGSFNPPHRAHETIVRACLAQLPIEKLLVLPSGRHPFKAERRDMAPPEIRLELCRLAFAFDARIAVSDYEQKVAGMSYTIDTLRHFDRPKLQLFWIIGSDNLAQLSTWKEHHAILQLATLVTYPRASYPCDAAALHGLDLSASEQQALLRNVLRVPPEEASATEIRARRARGEDVSQWLHPAVLAKILELRLYGA